MAKKYSHASKIQGFRAGYAVAAPIFGIILGIAIIQTIQYHTNEGARARRQKVSKGKLQLEQAKVYITTCLIGISLILITCQVTLDTARGAADSTTSNDLDIFAMLVPAISGSVQVIVQTEFLQSLHAILKNKPVFIGILTLVALSFCTAWGRTITLMIDGTSFQQNGSNSTSASLSKISFLLNYLWLGSAFVVDLILASLLCWSLKRARDEHFGIMSTDRMLTRLLVGFVTTFSLTAVVVLCTLLAFFMPVVGASAANPTGIAAFVFLQLMHSGIYGLSYLFTLNRRETIGTKMRADQQALSNSEIDSKFSRDISFDMPASPLHATFASARPTY